VPRILIIAYGNPMRCDDGLAWRAADALEEKFSSTDVELLRVHQLTPELAEAVSHAEAVIFVDAAVPGERQPGDIQTCEPDLPDGPPRFSHQLSPGAVLALARQLYAAQPRSFAVTLTGESFEHGELLSPIVEAALPALVARIEGIAQQFLCAG
jgi:hydrogenase maturation protease